MNKNIIAVIVAIVVVAVGAFIVVQSTDNKNAADNSSTTPQTSMNDTAANQDALANSQSDVKDVNPADSTAQSNQSSAENTITYSNDGFNPSTLTVAAGTTVTIKNNASDALQFASDPHPQHTDNPELNAGSLAPGQAKTVTLKKNGTFGFHNHLKSADKGSITVQ